MKKVTVTVPSVTYAIKLKRQLGSLNIKSKLVKLDSAKTGRSCEYGVEFPENYLLDAVSELKKHGINYYVYTGDDVK